MESIRCFRSDCRALWKCSTNSTRSRAFWRPTALVSLPSRRVWSHRYLGRHQRDRSDRRMGRVRTDGTFGTQGDLVSTTEPVISIKDLCVEFSRTRRNINLRDLVFMRTGRILGAQFWEVRYVSFIVL